MTVERDPFADLQQLTPDQLVAALAVYEFRDPHGHPLGNCAEFVELRRRAALSVPSRPQSADKAVA